MQTVSFAKLKEICRKKNDPNDDWISDYILWRPFSIYFSWLMIVLRIPSTIIAFVNILIFLSLLIMICFQEKIHLILSGISIQVYWLLDHVDGEVARFEMIALNKTNSRLGHFFDLVAHKFTPALFFLFGYSLSISEDRWYYVMAGILCGLGVLGIGVETANTIFLEMILKKPTSEQVSDVEQLNDPIKRPQFKNNLRIALLHRLKKLVMFPGWMINFTVACFLDAFLEPLTVFNFRFSYRGIFILAIAPFFTASMIGGIVWYSKIMSKIIHSDSQKAS